VLALGAVASTLFAIRLHEATKLPRAVQALLSSQLNDWVRVHAFDRLPAELVTNGDAPNVLVCDVGERETVKRHGEIMLFTDEGILDCRQELTIPAAPWIDARVAEENLTPVNDAIITDLWPEQPGKEIIIAQIHRDFSPSVLCIYDGRLRPLAMVWNDGHIHRVYWNEEHRLLVILARSNSLPEAVPPLNGENRPINADTSAPLILAALRAEDIRPGQSVLYPLTGTIARPAAPVQWILAEPWPEILPTEGDTRWNIVLAGLDEPDSQHRDALGRLRFVYSQLDSTGHAGASSAFYAHVDEKGGLLQPFVDEQGRPFTDVTGRTEPQFMKIEPSEEAGPEG
jgi:YD repeat-containing protein